MVNKISKRIVFILCLISFVLIFLCSLLTTSKVTEVANLNKYIPFYLLFFIILLALLYIFVKLTKNINHKYIYIVYLILIIIIPLFLYKLSIATFVNDRQHVLDFTFESLQGNYQQVFKGSYMSMFPWQYGLSLFWTIILKLCSVFYRNLIYDYSACQNIISLVNSLVSSMTLIICFFIVKRLSHNNEEAKLCYVFLSLTCIPFFMYSLFIYNDVPSIMFSLISTYFFVKYIQGNKIYNFLLSILFIGIAMILRFSAVIFAIAFMLVIMYHFLFEKRNYLNALLAVLFLIIPILISKLPYRHYEAVSNYNKMVNPEEYNIEDGQPILLNIAMGTDIDGNKYGWFSGTNIHTFVDVCKMDSTCGVEKAKEQISASLKTMSSSLPLTIDFFYNKMVSQWGDGTMGSLYYTGMTVLDSNRSIINFIYKGTSNIMINCYAKGHLILMCFLSLLAIIKKRNTNNISILDLTFEIIILGGFILSIFWETSGRYNLLFFYLIIVLSSNSFSSLFNSPIIKLPFINNK